MAQFVKDAGVWKPVRLPYVKDAGVWKPIPNNWVRDGGVWKQAFRRGGLTYMGYSYFATGGGAVTFPDMPFGEADPDRVIIVVTAHHSGSLTTDATVTNISIGGVTATLVTNGQQGRGIGAARVPLGTSGTVVVTITGAGAYMPIGVYRVLGLNSLSPTATITAPGSITQPANGFLVGAASALGSPISPITFNGLTTDFQEQHDSSVNLAVGHTDLDVTGLPVGVSASLNGNGSRRTNFIVAAYV